MDSKSADASANVRVNVRLNVIMASSLACPFSGTLSGVLVRRKLCPRVVATAEEAVLLIVTGRFAVRLDGGDLGERGLHGGALGDGVEPARQIGVVFPLHAPGIVIARPREGRDVGDRILVAAEIRHLGEPL